MPYATCAASNVLQLGDVAGAPVCRLVRATSMGNKDIADHILEDVMPVWLEYISMKVRLAPLPRSR